MKLQKLYNDKVLQKEFMELYAEVAKTVAYEDMMNGEDVSYVPKNVKILNRTFSKLEEMFRVVDPKGEQKKPSKGQSTAL